MLDGVPLAKHLKSVPEFAGGHHEKMAGSGYPKKLTREQMSIPARIMAIDDIFVKEKVYEDYANEFFKT